VNNNRCTQSPARPVAAQPEILSRPASTRTVRKPTVKGSIVLKSVCFKCHSPFEYRSHVTAQGKPLNGTCRHVCDDCRARRKRWLDKRRKRLVVAPIRKLSLREQRARPGEFTSRRLIARHLGIPPSLVADIERSALHKLRSSPELKEAFRQYQEEGMPAIEELVKTLRTPCSELLLGYQLEVADFRRVYERLEAEGLHEEAQQVLKGIIGCQQVIFERTGERL
jgi:hypothetical protein